MGPTAAAERMRRMQRGGDFSKNSLNFIDQVVDILTMDVRKRASWHGRRPESGDPTIVSRLLLSRRLRGL
jgi:hypothetical protein